MKRKLVRIEENARGIRRLEALIRAFCGSPYRNGQKESCGSRVADEGREHRRGDHERHDKASRLAAGCSKNEAARDIHHPSPQQGGSHDKQPPG